MGTTIEASPVTKCFEEKKIVAVFMFQISINEYVYFCFARHSREALILFN